MSRYQKFNSWGKLNSVVLGSYFYPEFFSKITNAKVREPLMRMAEEINQDLEGFEKVLRQSGASVIRATQPIGFFDVENPYRAPLQVRDRHTVIGSKMYQVIDDFDIPLTPVLESQVGPVTVIADSNNKYFHSIIDSIRTTHYNSDLDTVYCYNKYQEIQGSSWPDYQSYVSGNYQCDPGIQDELTKFKESLEYETKEIASLEGPNVINLPDRIVVGALEYCDYSTWLKDHIDDPRPVIQYTSKARHADGCFAVLGKNTILGIDSFINYREVFPEYNVVVVPMDNYQNQNAEYKIMKSKVNGAWWLAGEEHNEQFISYVENHLKEWVGFVDESIFDVNVLALDEHTICATNVTPEVEKNLQAQGIECIIVPWRHRFFVDGGLHCITLDLNRDH